MGMEIPDDVVVGSTRYDTLNEPEEPDMDAQIETPKKLGRPPKPTSNFQDPRDTPVFPEPGSQASRVAFVGVMRFSFGTIEGITVGKPSTLRSDLIAESITVMEHGVLIHPDTKVPGRPEQIFIGWSGIQYLLP
jgi:hypothetical protein